MPAAAITYARTNDVPLLGTCGGFQHVVVEFARNVLGITDQDGEARVVELSDRRFFVATLFVPQTSSAPGAARPLVSAYLAAARQPTAAPA